MKLDIVQVIHPQSQAKHILATAMTTLRITSVPLHNFSDATQSPISKGLKVVYSLPTRDR